MTFSSVIEHMAWYSIQFLGDLAVFLMSDTILPFVTMVILFVIVGVVGEIMYGC